MFFFKLQFFFYFLLFSYFVIKKQITKKSYNLNKDNVNVVASLGFV